MSDWQSVPAGSVVRFTRGVSWTAERERELRTKSTRRVLRIPNVQTDLVLDDVLLVDFPGGVPEKWRATPGSIVMVGSNGNPRRVGNAIQILSSDGDFLFASFLIAARARVPDLDERYLFHWIRSTETQDLITRSVHGSTGLSNLSMSFLCGLPLPSPPLEEQRRIAEILDTIDGTIQATERVIVKLELVRIGLLENSIPIGGLVPLKELASVSVGFVGPTQVHYTTPDRGVPFLRTGNIGTGQIRSANMRYVTHAFNVANQKSVLHEGDVVVSRVGYTGNAAVIEQHFAGVNCANMIIIRPGPRLASRFLSLLFESRLIGQQVQAMTAGSAQPVFNIKLVERLRVPSVGSDEQLGTVNAIHGIDQLLAAERDSVRKLIATRAGLAADLLSGRVRTVAA